MAEPSLEFLGEQVAVLQRAVRQLGGRVDGLTLEMAEVRAGIKIIITGVDSLADMYQLGLARHDATDARIDAVETRLGAVGTTLTTLLAEFRAFRDKP